MTKFSLIIFLVSIILSSCTRELIVTEYVEKEYAWKQDSRFQYEQTILRNAHYSKGIFYLLGNYNFSKISISEELPNNASGGDVIHYPLVFDYEFDSKFPISDQYYVAASNKHKRLVIVPNDVPHNNNSRKIIPFENIDSDFSEFELVNSFSISGIGLTSNDFCLVPYRTITSSTPRFLLMKIRPRYVSQSLDMDTGYTKIIDYPEGIVYGPEIVRSVSAIDDGFIFSGLDKSYKIDTLGNIMKVYEGNILRVINTGSQLFAFAGEKYLRSLDNGLSWIEIADVDPNFARMSYCTINDNFIGFYNSQIFKIDLGDASITVKELVNEGLEGKRITSIVGINDSLVFITSLNGLFYRNQTDFFDAKEQ